MIMADFKYQLRNKRNVLEANVNLISEKLSRIFHKILIINLFNFREISKSVN